MKKSILLSVLLSALTCLHPPSANAIDDTQTEMLQGAWRSDGYGYLIEVSGNRCRLYSESPTGAILEDKGKIHHLFAEFPSIRFPDKNILEVGMYPSSKHIRFHRIPPPRAAEKTPPPSTPLGVFDCFAATLAAHYPFFDLHGVDWTQRVAAARPLVTPDMPETALFDMMLGMLDGINDGHLGLMAKIKGKLRKQSKYYLRDTNPILEPLFSAQSKYPTLKAFTKKWKQDLKENVNITVLNNEYKTAGRNTIVWGQIGDVAYLSIAQFGLYGRSESIESDLRIIHRTLDQVFQDIRFAKALIIDCSLSRGGRDEIALAIASRFLTTPNAQLAFEKYAADAKQPQKYYGYVEPSSRPAYSKPVTLVTSDHTVSAAEIFTFAMRALPKVTHVGRPTNGSLSDMLTKPLPNGWMMALSNEVYIDPNGIEFEGRGITPEIDIPLFEANQPYQSHARNLLRIVADIQNTPSPRNP